MGGYENFCRVQEARRLLRGGPSVEEQLRRRIKALERKVAELEAEAEVHDNGRPGTD
jgi:hypothetical protein